MPQEDYSKKGMIDRIKALEDREAVVPAEPQHLSAALTDITYTAPGTPDFAVQDFVDVEGDGSKGFSFKNKDEANSILAVIHNLQVRVAFLESVLEAMGAVLPVQQS